MKKLIVQGVSGNSIPSYNLCVDETNLYCLNQNTKTVVVYDKNTGERKTDITLAVTAKGIAYDGTNFWLLISDGSFKKTDKNFNVISSFSKSSALPGDLVSSVDYGDIYVSDYHVYIAYKGCTDSSGSSTSYKSCIAKYNKDGTFVSKEDVFTGTGYKFHITGISNNKLWVVINSTRCIQLNEDLTICSSTNLSNTKWLSMCWDKTRNTMFLHYDSTYGTLGEYYIVPASAHTLLPEPITKTPTNTMKIQYDFTCDYVFPLDMPLH